MKTIIILFVSILAVAAPLGAEQASGDEGSMDYLFMSARPAALIPLEEGAHYFNFGGTMGLSAELGISALPFLFFKADLDYGFMTIHAPETMSLFSVSAGAGARYSILPWLAVKGFGTGGISFGFFNGVPGTGLGGYFSAGAGLDFSVTPSLSLGLLASCAGYPGLFVGVQAGLSASYDLFSLGIAVPAVREQPGIRPAPLLGQETGTAGGLEIGAITFENVFPIFQKYYDDHPIGRAVIRNTSTSAVSDISVSFMVRQFMDSPKKYRAIFDLKPGESLAVDLNALFTTDILGITQATKVVGEIVVDYVLNGRKGTASRTETLRVYDRNALIWTDNRMAAAFVTDKDPAVLKYSNQIMGIVKAAENRAVSKNLQAAMAIHEALCQSGVAYVRDPRTPYADASVRKAEIDFLKFPRQTLEYRAGDCDDLSILYCALLESIGIETAFITIPGHIYMAVSLDMTPDEARKAFRRSDELIIKDGKVWVPVEVTVREDGFLKAWREGAREWRENDAGGTAALYPMRSAWKIYEPVGLFSESPADLPLPSRPELMYVFARDVTDFVNAEIVSQEAELQARIAKPQSGPEAVNALGVLYARYGQMEKAEKQFSAAISKSEYVPALINLGNIQYLAGEYAKALRYYERALKKAPHDSHVLLCNARANHALEDYASAKELFDRVKAMDAELAKRFSYLEMRGAEAARASDAAGTKETVVWAES
jgi:tetratricopeptide (TPR) repeat protein